FVPFAERAVADARLVVDLARQPPAFVPEAPGTGAQAVAVVAPPHPRFAVPVPGLEHAAAALAGSAPQQRVGGGELDDPRRGGPERRQLIAGETGGARIDLLRHQRAVLPAIFAPHGPLVEVVAPHTVQHAVHVCPLDHFRAALVEADLGTLPHAVGAMAPLGLAAAAQDLARDVGP